MFKQICIFKFWLNRGYAGRMLRWAAGYFQAQSFKDCSTQELGEAGEGGSNSLMAGGKLTYQTVSH